MIDAKCPHCQAIMRVDEKYLGKRGKCTNCGQIITIAVTGAVPAAAPAPAPVAADPFGDPFGVSAPKPAPAKPAPAAPPPAAAAPPAGGNPFGDPFGSAPAAAPKPAPAAPPPAAAAPPAGGNPFGDPFGSSPAAAPKPAPAAAPTAAPTPASLPFLDAPTPASPAAAARPMASPAPSPAPPPATPAKPAASPSPFDHAPVDLGEESAPAPLAANPFAPSPAPAAKPAAAAPSPAPTAAPTPVVVRRPSEPEAPITLVPAASRRAEADNLAHLTIVQIDIFVVELPARATLAYPRGRLTSEGRVVNRILVRLAGSDGTVGWGEATTRPFDNETVLPGLVTTLREVLVPALLGQPAWDIEGLGQRMEAAIAGNATAKAAIDMALHDYLARSLEVPLYVLLGGRRQPRVPVALSISAGGIDDTVAGIRVGQQQGYRAFTLHPPVLDVPAVGALLGQVVPLLSAESWLAIHAHGACPLDVARDLVHVAASFGVQAILDPLEIPNPRDLSLLAEQSRTRLGIAAPLADPTAALDFFAHRGVDLAVLTLGDLGSIRRALQLGLFARAAGRRLLLATHGESALGAAAGLHVAAALGIDLPCEFDGLAVLQSAYATSGPVIRNGSIDVPTGPGLGVEVDESALASLTA